MLVVYKPTQHSKQYTGLKYVIPIDMTAKKFSLTSQCHQTTILHINRCEDCKAAKAWCRPEMITIRFASWISGRIVSLQPDTDILKLLSNGNRIRIRISETLLSIFRGFRLLEKLHVACSFISYLYSETSFRPSVP